MESIRGKVEQLQVEGGGVTFSCWMTLTVDGKSRSLSFTITGRDADLRPGHHLALKISRNPSGEEVVFCRNLTTGRILVDRINFQATRITCWTCAGCLAVGVLLLIAAPILVLGILGWIFHHLL